MSEKFFITRKDIPPSPWTILQLIGSIVKYDELVFRLHCTEENGQSHYRKVRNPDVFRDGFIAVIGDLRDTYSIRRDGLCSSY